MNFLFLIGITLGYLFLNFDKMFVGHQEVIKAWERANAQIEQRFDLALELKYIFPDIDFKEKMHLEGIIRERNHYLMTKEVSEIIKANRKLSSTLKQIIVKLENYPDLENNISFNNFLERLCKNEIRLVNAFKAYNSCVKKYNNYVAMGPNKFYVRYFGFNKKKYLDSEMLNFIFNKEK